MRLSELYNALAAVCEAAVSELRDREHRPLCEMLAASYRHLALLAQASELAN